jgi:hypothetical protein
MVLRPYRYNFTLAPESALTEHHAAVLAAVRAGRPRTIFFADDTHETVDEFCVLPWYPPCAFADVEMRALLAMLTTS